MITSAHGMLVAVTQIETAVKHSPYIRAIVVVYNKATQSPQALVYPTPLGWQSAYVSTLTARQAVQDFADNAPGMVVNQSTKDQLACHLFGWPAIVFEEGSNVLQGQPLKTTIDLEPDRPDVGVPTFMMNRCNP